MGEVPEVSKEVEILLHSPRGLVVIFCMSSFRVATYVSTNTKKPFNVRHFRPLTSAQTPTLYRVTSK